MEHPPDPLPFLDALSLNMDGGAPVECPSVQIGTIGTDPRLPMSSPSLYMDPGSCQSWRGIPRERQTGIHSPGLHTSALTDEASKLKECSRKTLNPPTPDLWDLTVRLGRKLAVAAKG